MKQSIFTGMMALKNPLVLTGLLALAACASPQVRFHTLMQAPDAEPLQPREGSVQADITVTSVTVPAQVDRSELVIRKTDSELLVLSSDWWSASLGEEIRSALVAGFGPGATDAPRVGLRLQITRFDAVPGDQAWLEARYRVTAREGERQLSCSARLRTTASAGDGQTVEALVMAQQQNLQLLAAHIMSAASGLTSGRGCPAP